MTRIRSLASGTPVSVIGAISLGLLLLSTAVIFTGVFRKPFAAASREVVADFPRAPQLQTGDQVRIDGSIDGRVKRIQPGPGGRGVRTTLQVNKSAGPIYADASARLRVKTLLGGAFYVDLDRGTPSAGPIDDRVIPLGRTSVQVEIEDVTDIFRGGAVTGLKTMPGKLAEVLSDPEAPTKTLRKLSDVAPDLQAGLRALRGQAPGPDLAGVVRSTARAVKALDRPSDQMRILVSGAAAILDTTGRRQAELRSVLRQAPAATAELTTTLARLHTTLGIAHGLVARLQGPAPDVAPTLAALRPTIVSTDHLLVRAKPLVTALRPTLTSLARTATHGVPLIDGLWPSLARLDDEILPYLDARDRRTGKPTSVMIGGFLAGFGGSAGQQDQNGHFVRFPASGGASSVYLPCSSRLVDPDAKSTLACHTLQQALENYFDYLPLPGKGTR